LATGRRLVRDPGNPGSGGSLAWPTR